MTLDNAQTVVARAHQELSSSASRIARWNGQAPGEWCGVWMAALMRSVGLTPPSGYQAAHNWSNFGTEVKPSELQPGDVLVYGFQHVGLYVGGGQMISGNWSGRVGASPVPGEIAGTKLTAIRRPPYQGGFTNNVPTAAERRKHERVASHEDLGSGGIFEGVPGAQQGQEVLEGETSVGAVAGGLAGEVVNDILGNIAGSAEPLMLNIALVGGGAFLVYYGVALLAGADEPGVKLLRGVRKAGEGAAAA